MVAVETHEEDFENLLSVFGDVFVYEFIELSQCSGEKAARWGPVRAKVDSKVLGLEVGGSFLSVAIVQVSSSYDVHILSFLKY